MEAQKQWNTISQKDGPKENIPLKCKPSVVNRLKREAASKSMGLSPYCEELVTNYASVEQAWKNAFAELREAKQKISMLQAELTKEKTQRQKEGEELNNKLAAQQADSANNSSRQKNEAEDLKKRIEAMNEQFGIYQNERFLWLFEQMKGTTGIVKDAYGPNFQITFNELQDLQKAITYSFRLKK